ncbi:MAG: 2-C-methyl-D-erythritol 4-phosphate cytidylyltransferase [Bacteroidales bacterium]
MKISAIITAGGAGKRLPGKVKKQFLLLGNKPILFHTIERFLTKKIVNELIISLPEDDFAEASESIRSNYPKANIKFVKGGKERQDSVYNALLACSPDCDIVLIHDGVRPFFGKDIIETMIEKVKVGTGVIPVSKVKFTVKECESGFVKQTIPRENLVNVHTPQCFVYQDILNLNKEAVREKKLYTDDASLMEEKGMKITTVLESDNNIKITTKEDLIFAEFLLLKLKY